LFRHRPPAFATFLEVRARKPPAKEPPMFRISLLLWLIALAALNLTILRYCDAIIGDSPKLAGLIGLMPLFDFSALSLSIALTRRFRFALVRREVSKSIVDSAAVVSGTVLALATLSCLLFPEIILQMLERLYTPFDAWVGVSTSSPESRAFLVGALLSLIVSGPPILVTLVLGFIHSRYRLEIVRRNTAAG
jgi:hypothetical protein